MTPSGAVSAIEACSSSITVPPALGLGQPDLDLVGVPWPVHPGDAQHPGRVAAQDPAVGMALERERAAQAQITPRFDEPAAQVRPIGHGLPEGLGRGREHPPEDGGAGIAGGDQLRADRTFRVPFAGRCRHFHLPPIRQRVAAQVRA